MTTWHAPTEVLRHYATGGIDDVTACSIEAHLERCAACRGIIAADADPVLIEAMWDGLVDVVDRPHPGLVERALRRIGLDEGTSRLVAATPGLRVAWVAAVALIVGIVVLACQATDSGGAFLALAPILPMVGVAAAFAPGTDPAGEIGEASPLFGFGLVLRRAEAVLVTSIAILGAGALALPDLEPRDAGWILPALTLAFLTIAVSGRVPVIPAAGTLSAAWLLGLVLLPYLDGRRPGVVEHVVFSASGQAVVAVTAAISLAAVLLRGDLSSIDRGA